MLLINCVATLPCSNTNPLYKGYQKVVLVYASAGEGICELIRHMYVYINILEHHQKPSLMVNVCVLSS